MCECVKENVDDMVDVYYDHVVEEIEYNLMVFITNYH